MKTSATALIALATQPSSAASALAGKAAPASGFVRLIAGEAAAAKSQPLPKGTPAPLAKPAPDAGRTLSTGSKTKDAAAHDDRARAEPGVPPTAVVPGALTHAADAILAIAAPEPPALPAGKTKTAPPATTPGAATAADARAPGVTLTALAGEAARVAPATAKIAPSATVDGSTARPETQIWAAAGENAPVAAGERSEGATRRVTAAPSASAPIATTAITVAASPALAGGVSHTAAAMLAPPVPAASHAQPSADLTARLLAAAHAEAVEGAPRVAAAAAAVKAQIAPALDSNPPGASPGATARVQPDARSPAAAVVAALAGDTSRTAETRPAVAGAEESATALRADAAAKSAKATAGTPDLKLPGAGSETPRQPRSDARAPTAAVVALAGGAPRADVAKTTVKAKTAPAPDIKVPIATAETAVRAQPDAGETASTAGLADGAPRAPAASALAKPRISSSLAHPATPAIADGARRSLATAAAAKAAPDPTAAKASGTETADAPVRTEPEARIAAALVIKAIEGGARTAASTASLETVAMPVADLAEMPATKPKSARSAAPAAKAETRDRADRPDKSGEADGSRAAASESEKPAKLSDGQAVRSKAAEAPANDAPVLRVSLQPTAPVHAEARAADTHPALSREAVAHATPAMPAVVMRVHTKDGATRAIEIRLDPPDLGHVDVRLETGSDGKLKAVLQADNSQAFELLKRESGALEAALRDAGVSLSEDGLSFALNGEGAGSQGAHYRDRAYAGAAVRRDDTIQDITAAANDWRNGVVDISV